jgi:hypothetical protein
VAAWLRSIITARRDGFAIAHGRDSIVFTGSGGATVIASTSEGGPLLDELHRQELVKQLSKLGLRTRRAPAAILSR